MFRTRNRPFQNPCNNRARNSEKELMNMLLAQSASLDAAMSTGLGIIAKFLFIVAVIVIAHGGWQARSGNADMAKMSIAGGLLLALAVLIAEALFNAGGMPTIPIAP